MEISNFYGTSWIFNILLRNIFKGSQEEKND